MSLFVIDTKGGNEEILNLHDEPEEEILESEESDEESSECSESESCDSSSSETVDSKHSILKALFEDSKTELFPLTKVKRTIRKSSRSARTKEEEKIIQALLVAKAKRQEATPKSLVDILSKNLSLDDEADEEFIVMPRGSDDDSDDDPVIIREIPKLPKLIKKSEKKIKKKKNEDYDFNEVLIEYDRESGATETLKKVRSEKMHKMLQEKSIAMKPGLESMESSPIAPFVSLRKLKKLRQAERAKTKGGEWFNLPATEVTDEVKRDLEVLQMRSVLDTKTFYKKNDLKVLPKYFQIGHVEDNAADFYHSRIPKKDRKRTMVEELMADAEFQQRSKQKFKEIVHEKKRINSKAHREARRLKKRKK